MPARVTPTSGPFCRRPFKEKIIRPFPIQRSALRRRQGSEPLKAHEKTIATGQDALSMGLLIEGHVSIAVPPLELVHQHLIEALEPGHPDVRPVLPPPLSGENNSPIPDPTQRVAPPSGERTPQGA
jgi:hypothetical protein